jgi:hypothetical protein
MNRLPATWNIKRQPINLDELEIEQENKRLDTVENDLLRQLLTSERQRLAKKLLRVLTELNSIEEKLDTL